MLHRTNCPAGHLPHWWERLPPPSASEATAARSRLTSVAWPESAQLLRLMEPGLRANADDAGSDDVFPCLEGRVDLVLRVIEHAVRLVLHRVQSVGRLLADVVRPGIGIPPQLVSPQPRHDTARNRPNDELSSRDFHDRSPRTVMVRASVLVKNRR